MFWRLITKIVVDIVAGLIVELVLTAILNAIPRSRKPRTASVAYSGAQKGGEMW